MKRGEQENYDWKTFPDDLSKSEQHDPTHSKLSVYPWRFNGDDKTLKRRFQTSFHSKYPWIEYSIKEDVPVRFCCELAFLGEKKLSSFFSCLKRLKKLSTKYNGPRKTSSVALISVECDLSHPDSVDIENFIEEFKL